LVDKCSKLEIIGIKLRFALPWRDWNTGTAKIPSDFNVSLKSITSRLTKEEKNEKNSVAL